MFWFLLLYILPVIGAFTGFMYMERGKNVSRGTLIMYILISLVPMVNASIFIGATWGYLTTHQGIQAWLKQPAIIRESVDNPPK